MNNDRIKQIISTFFERGMSKSTQLLFGKWFRLDEYQTEKNAAMEELWDKSPSEMNEHTIDDLNHVVNQIGDDERRKSFSWHTVLKYAAVVALIIASTAILTYKLGVPQPQKLIQLTANYGESKSVTLADGTVVAVNSGSTLIYPEEFTSSNREVFLSGEANFHVAKDAHKPFIVKTQYVDVTALGTKFFVQSYPDADCVKAVLEEGSVRVDVNDLHPQSFILKPNEQLIYTIADKKTSVTTVDAEKLSSWKEGYLIFQGSDFTEIVKAIERKYDVNINYDAQQMSHESLNVRFKPQESLKEVMDILSMLVSGSSYRINGTTVYFFKK
jgi:transmembrane sensor